MEHWQTDLMVRAASPFLHPFTPILSALPYPDIDLLDSCSCFRQDDVIRYRRWVRQRCGHRCSRWIFLVCLGYFCCLSYSGYIDLRG